MKKSVKQLREVLKQEIDVYREMLEISIEKTNIIIEGQIKKLEEITEQEQKLIIKIGKLEDIRENIVFNIQKGLGISEDIDMSKIMPHLDEEDKDFIEEQKEELLKILNQLKDRNTLNGTLINDSLEYINLNIDLLTNNSFENIYGNKSKEINLKPAKRIFDSKA
ncbi:flagellar protein FlgN [Sporosalibacterium faouarense]|uniref:flagellar protein FlgN n=1 Tax=Sporosalibacterium faouarense TaxID=516123 RepID=UPI00192C3147|nr:flagellar protein FlgN [Sporosalibacterium faouarense]